MTAIERGIGGPPTRRVNRSPLLVRLLATKRGRAAPSASPSAAPADDVRRVVHAHVDTARWPRARRACTTAPRSRLLARTPADMNAVAAWPDGNDDVIGRRIPYGSGSSCSKCSCGRTRRNSDFTRPFVSADSIPSAALNRSDARCVTSSDRTRGPDRVPEDAVVGGCREPVEQPVERRRPVARRSSHRPARRTTRPALASQTPARGRAGAITVPGPRSSSACRDRRRTRGSTA